MGNDESTRTRQLTRRGLFTSMSNGVGTAALATLLGRDLFAAETEPAGPRVYDVRPRKPHFEPKATAVIHLFMNGGPSRMDLFDPKPVLDKHHGEAYFDKVAADLTGPEQAGGLLKSPFKFAQYGKSGVWLSELMPHLAKRVDDICVI